MTQNPAFAALLPQTTPRPSMRTAEYQERLTALCLALGHTPKEPLWLSGGRRGWYLSCGLPEGDLFLPPTKGCETWVEALTAAEKWLAAR